MDPYFRVEVLGSMPNPQQLTWAAMHQDYSEEYVFDERDRFPDEVRAGELIVKHLLLGNRGHFGSLEHPQINFSIGYFPHSVMQQLRTHRVGFTMDCQSMRYTGQRIVDLWEKGGDIESIFYLRPVGEYTDRQGKKYRYTEEKRESDLCFLEAAARRYWDSVVNDSLSEEHARGLLPFDYRQHFVFSVNARSLMHILDLRAKADAQLEIQQLCQMLMVHFKNWMPAVADWYEQNRWGKARLAP
jgi:thymidylate synthase (FAD)